MKNIYEIVRMDKDKEVIVDVIRVQNQVELEEVKSSVKEGYFIKECTMGQRNLIDYLFMVKEIVEDVEYIGTVGVDSGQLLISDPCYIEKGIVEAFDYEGAYSQVLNGWALSFGFQQGDGQYDVYARKDDDGRIIKIEMEQKFPPLSKLR